METKDEEESTTDETSSDISVTAPGAAESGACSARDLPIQRSKATPKRLVQDDSNPKKGRPRGRSDRLARSSLPRRRPSTEKKFQLQ